MIKGLVLSGMRFQQTTWINVAERAVKFIYQNLWHNNHLLTAYTHEQGYLSAYLDDYAFLLDAILTLLQYRWNN